MASLSMRRGVVGIREVRVYNKSNKDKKINLLHRFPIKYIKEIDYRPAYDTVYFKVDNPDITIRISFESDKKVQDFVDFMSKNFHIKVS